MRSVGVGIARGGLDTCRDGEGADFAVERMGAVKDRVACGWDLPLLLVRVFERVVAIHRRGCRGRWLRIRRPRLIWPGRVAGCAAEDLRERSRDEGTAQTSLVFLFRHRANSVPQRRKRSFRVRPATLLDRAHGFSTGRARSFLFQRVRRVVEERNGIVGRRRIFYRLGNLGRQPFMQTTFWQRLDGPIWK